MRRDVVEEPSFGRVRRPFRQHRPCARRGQACPQLGEHRREPGRTDALPELGGYRMGAACPVADRGHDHVEVGHLLPPEVRSALARHREHERLVPGRPRLAPHLGQPSRTVPLGTVAASPRSSSRTAPATVTSPSKVQSPSTARLAAFRSDGTPSGNRWSNFVIVL